MPELNALAVVAATVALFAIGGAYYAAMGDRLVTAGGPAYDEGEMPPWKVAAELLRCLILATVVAGLASQGDVDEWTGGLLLGLALWIGFPFVLLTGAVIHEGTPWRLAAIHAGDWLLKLAAAAVIGAVLG